MDLNKDSYTKDEVTALIQPIEQELTNIKVLVTDANKVLEKNKELEKNNLTNSIKLEMTKAGLDSEKMFDLVEADTIEKAQSKITKMVEINKTRQLDSSFRPGDRKKQDDEYSSAEKNGDIAGMLKTKFTKLFE